MLTTVCAVWMEVRCAAQGSALSCPQERFDPSLGCVAVVEAAVDVMAVVAETAAVAVTVVETVVVIDHADPLTRLTDALSAVAEGTMHTTAPDTREAVVVAAAAAEGADPTPDHDPGPMVVNAVTPAAEAPAHAGGTEVDPGPCPTTKKPAEVITADTLAPTHDQNPPQNAERMITPRTPDPDPPCRGGRAPAATEETEEMILLLLSSIALINFLVLTHKLLFFWYLFKVLCLDRIEFESLFCIFQLILKFPFHLPFFLYVHADFSFLVSFKQ
eukprot:GHVO01023604.1.p1 GENE.GHVO01023604.1~~GHVO01023604.1.p1  ORF type:complete len:273 (+),score=25.45 GHVO01023604.1:81-899(+)